MTCTYSDQEWADIRADVQRLTERAEEARSALSEVLDAKRRIIKLRNSMIVKEAGELTLNELAELIGLSRQRVRQILASAGIDNLRKLPRTTIRNYTDEQWATIREQSKQAERDALLTGGSYARLREANEQLRDALSKRRLMMATDTRPVGVVALLSGAQRNTVSKARWKHSSQKPEPTC